VIPNSTPKNCRQQLADGLVLRTADDERDVERVAAFNGLVHGNEITSMTRDLFLCHPHTSLDDLIFIEDQESEQIVSSLCLIPWTWCCEGVEIPAGELGIVGTLEDYRRRGLIRAQMSVFEQRLRERGCLLSQIQGIPYYYRQFDYEYALPLEGGLRLEMRHVPEPLEAAFTFHPATPDDVPVLMQLYDEAAQNLAIHSLRDEAIWCYLLKYTEGTGMVRDTWLIQDADANVAGYFCVPKYHFGEELAVSEVSNLGFDAALAVLNQLKRLALEREKPGLRLNLPAGCTLMRLARSLDAYDLGTYAWQIRVPDVVALLRALRPVLERRVAGSPFAGLSKDVRINLYRETILLRFEKGQLTRVENVGLAESERALTCPASPFIPLLLGYRTVDELHAAYPDVSVPPAWRLLVDTLFPKLAAFIYTIY
jgi:GNAT superfamily N-acetyltransferase